MIGARADDIDPAYVEYIERLMNIFFAKTLCFLGKNLYLSDWYGNSMVPNNHGQYSNDKPLSLQLGFVQYLDLAAKQGSQITK